MRAPYDVAFVLDDRGEIDLWVFMPKDGSPPIEVSTKGGVYEFHKALRKKGLKDIAKCLEDALRLELRDGVVTGFDREGWPLYAPPRS